ncbi:MULTISPECIES: type I glyceraldehyde-3-phosphate dehydrogenase [unclassified Pseudodesulfovibrio]|uniref:type I glyceraldehyde-3-phosphate dehydrogenase n=1 Tax=unclassified Pseudodesulfovibrio TaxID=2661612 RepID=UPI000FEB8E04|nr:MULTISPECIES: type I glyceraldehyde-3-phosphate dehydrogenase [unclassified Pseudodesulfovibrio]MCJ2163739.1 type I glyceraldehyde-3-phosphate dehydrogenase [Pseudodesulfovibrio sp. S3-i]RWU06008.1 type I glyceraldehyde-3-phosphate dehydrogenase [Pseudodesulfovibrio sp. S3]
MATKIGLNGFGRIGRYLARLLADRSDLELVAVNARASNEDLAHLLKYDSVHGRFLDVQPSADGFVIAGKSVKVTRNAPGEWTWGDLGCDLVVESTGKFTDRESCEKHLACGAKKVLISAPGKNADVTVVVGVNDGDLKPEHKIISNASCTTNCLAPVAKVVNDKFGIKHGIMTTVHSYTMSQRILDGSHKDLRRARACAMNMVPTTTGAAKAVGLVIPELNGILDGMAIRVPTPNVSLVDLVCELKRETTADEVNAALKAAANDSMGYTEEPLVSTDFMGSTFGGVVDSSLTRVMGGTQLKLIIWYDNEAGFTNQLLRLTGMAAGML